MPKLKKNDQHHCPLCKFSSVRRHLKSHLTSAGKKGPRCPGLRVVIPVGVWNDQVLPYYTTNAKLVDLSGYLGLPVLKAKLKEQAKIIKQMKKKVAAYDDLVIENMRLNEVIRRLAVRLDKARVDSDAKKYLVRGKNRMCHRLDRSKAEVKRLKSNTKRLTSRLAVAVSPRPGPSPSAYKDLSRSGKWRRSN